MIKGSRIFSIFAISVMIASVFTACTNKQQIDSKILLDTDRYYSGLSAKKGMNAAFLAMFDSVGVMLKPKHTPIEGYKAIKAALISQNDSTFTLTWEPKFAKVSASGDMGYTYGTYKMNDKATDSISGKGTYTTIWMKKENGKWKAMLDTGNPGLGE